MTTLAEQLGTDSQSTRQIGPMLVATLTTPKALIGILLILFGLYQLYNALPDSWNKLISANSQVQQLEKKKQIVTERLEQLRSTDKNLGKPSVEIYQLQPSQTPQLATLEIAQNVLQIAEATGNKLVSLTPSDMRVINYDKVVDIPIEDDASTAEQAAPATDSSNASTTSAEPTAEPATPVSPPPSSTDQAQGNPQTALQCAEYQLIVSGNVQTIVQFIYQLLDLKTAIFIEKFTVSADNSGITQGPSPVTSKTTGGIVVPKVAVLPAPSIKSLDSNKNMAKEPVAKALKPEVVAKGNLTLSFTFLIPWKPAGNN